MLCAFTNGMSGTRRSQLMKDIMRSHMTQTEAMSSSDPTIDENGTAVVPSTYTSGGRTDTA